MLDDVADFAALIEESLGFWCEGDRAGALGDLLQERLRATGCAGLAAYRARLASAAHGPGEQRALADKLVVGETYFFREEPHFELLASAVVPERLRRRGAGEPMRLLSVGCSSGEEPYSLAIALRELGIGPEHALVHGIDIHAGAIARARAATYSAWALRTTSAELLARYFRRRGAGYELSDDVRRAVTFDVRNLFESDPALWVPGSLDVIVCRNVFIYFSPRMVAAALRRFAAALAPGGFLVLGHSEIVADLPDEIDVVRAHGAFCYWRRDALGLVQPGLEVVAGPPSPAPSAAAVDTGPLARGPVESYDALREATRLFRAERFREALAALDHPSVAPSAEVELLRASILTNQGELAAAEEACSAVLALDPGSATARYLIAMCRVQSGDLDDAVAHQRRALDLDPAFALAHLQLGILARRRGDRDAAVSALRRALRLLEHEDAATIELLGGGFGREALADLCSAELSACGGAP